MSCRLSFLKFRYICNMKRFVTTLSALFFAIGLYAQPISWELPNPDAKVLGMGGVAMTAMSGSHAIYSNAAMAIFSQSPSQVSASYYGQGGEDAYAVSGSCRFDYNNLAQIGWRQLFRGGADGGDLALDMGYSRRINDRWAIGVVGRYQRFSQIVADPANALAVDLHAAYTLPLEHVGKYSTLRAGARLSNLGGCLGDVYTTLPMRIVGGVSLDTFLTDSHEITIATDFGYCFTPSQPRGFQLSIGAEYNLVQLIQFRAGYHYGESSFYDPSYASLGAGVRILHLRLDFAYLFAARNTLLRDTYSFSFGIDF